MGLIWETGNSPPVLSGSVSEEQWGKRTGTSSTVEQSATIAVWLRSFAEVLTVPGLDGGTAGTSA